MKPIITYILFLITICAKAQMPIPANKHNLEKKVSIEVKNQQISQVLQKSAGRVIFISLTAEPC